MRRRDFSHAEEFLHRQGRHEAIDFVRLDRELIVGFSPVARDLREKLIRSDPRRGGQLPLLEDHLADRVRDLRGVAVELLAVGDVEIGFVERKRLDLIREALKDRADRTAFRAVELEIRWYENELGAKAHRLARRHGRADAELAGLVIRGAEHATGVRRPAHAQGFSPVLRVKLGFHRGVEAIHINVDDFAHM